jgi:hypothetical protein
MQALHRQSILPGIVMFNTPKLLELGLGKLQQIEHGSRGNYSRLSVGAGGTTAD